MVMVRGNGSQGSLLLEVGFWMEERGTSWSFRGYRSLLLMRMPTVSMLSSLLRLVCATCLALSWVVVRRTSGLVVVALSVEGALLEVKMLSHLLALPSILFLALRRLELHLECILNSFSMQY